MQTRLSCLSAALVLLMSSAAIADESSDTAMEGSYLLFQDDKYQRVLSLGPGGVAHEISQEQSVVGFTAGQGSWTATASDAASVKIVDFTYNVDDGKPIGPSVTTYQLRFADNKDGRFQRVSGEFKGAQHASGQNVLKTDSEPLRTYRARFSGERITTN